MYYYLNGEIVKIFDNSIVLDNNGIGYLIYVTSNTLSNIKLNQTYKIYIHYVVREDEQKFYGFLNEDEKRIFLSLTSVNNVGPKTALDALSSIPYNRLFDAIIYKDVKTISQAKGIGKKTAERIILELSEKISLDVKNDNIIQIQNQNISDQNQEIIDAQNALIELGYNVTDAKIAVNKAATLEKTTQNIIKLALKFLLEGGR